VSFHILAVDTTGEFGSLALWDGSGVLEEISLHSPEGFGHVLFDEIHALLSRHGLSLADLDGFASAAGPGSFTGVRVGLTAVKGLAEATGHKVVAVSNLAALAWFGTRPLRAVVMDARRGEVYGAVYDAALRLVRDEVVMKFGDWLGTLPKGDLELVAGGFVPPPQDWPVTQAPRSLAGAIASIAAPQFAEGLAKDPAQIDANYVRRSDAELLWRDPR
jgi:tRNA threonylcarbamoyladenosine biosynthesis protein TsaB